MVLALAHALKDQIDPAPDIVLVGDGVRAGRRSPPRDGRVEIELLDELEALDVGAPIAQWSTAAAHPPSRRSQCRR